MPMPQQAVDIGAACGFTLGIHPPPRSAVQKRSPIELDSEFLPDRQAARLLERASEMDVARTGGSSVADLRAAAAEAGISAHSFDAALAEMQRAANPVVRVAQARPRGRFWKWSFAALSLTLIAATVIVPRLFPASVAAVPGASMVEHP